MIYTHFLGFSPNEIRVARHLDYYASKSWGYCLKKFSVIAEELSLSYKTIQRAVQKLVKMKFILAERGGCNAKKIYSLPKLKQAFSQCPLNVHLIEPTLYIQKEKDIADANLIVQEKKGCLDVLRELGLSFKETMVFVAFIVTNKVTRTALSESVDRFMAYSKKNRIRNKGGLFRMILKGKIEEEGRAPDGKPKASGPFYSGVPQSYINKWARPGESYAIAGARLKERYFKQEKVETK